MTYSRIFNCTRGFVAVAAGSGSRMPRTQAGRGGAEL